MDQALNADSRLLRIFIGEADKVDHRPLYEAIVFAARKAQLAGATVTRGIMAFGASSKIHTAKLIDISQDLPIVVEIIDHDEKIQAFLPTVNDLMEKAACGGLVTIEKAQVLYYKSARNPSGGVAP